MRGHDEQQEAIFTYLTLKQCVPADHPLRAIRALVDKVLQEISPQLALLYSRYGRPSIAPEKQLRALLLQVFYSVRSERLLIESLSYNFLFRWFVGLSLDEEVWDVTVFTKNRERLLGGDVAERFFQQVVELARAQGLLSDEHFTVDGTLIAAWASRRSFHPKDDPPERGSGARGRKLLRDTHESKTDADARLYKKSAASEAKPSYLGHVLAENRHGLVVGARVTEAGTRAEREAAMEMIKRLRGGDQSKAITLGADKAYQEKHFIAGLRALGVVPHVAEYSKATRHWPNWLRAEEREAPGYLISQRQRKKVEGIFGWLKSVATVRQTKFRGRRRVDWMFRLAAAGYNLLRLTKLAAATT
jgi:transposase